MTVTRSSGSGMRDLPCAGDGNRPGFSHPRISCPGFSRLGFQHQLLHAFATGQEERNKPESSAAKLYCLHLQELECKSKSSITYIFRSQSAREQECKSKSKSFIAYMFRSKSARAKARERMAKPRPFLRRIILRLGHITP